MTEKYESLWTLLLNRVPTAATVNSASSDNRNNSSDNVTTQAFLFQGTMGNLHSLPLLPIDASKGSASSELLLPPSLLSIPLLVQPLLQVVP
jgi:hypothetical protein